MFYLYQIECQTPNHVYIGISQNPDRRIEKHRLGLGARFTALHGVKSWTMLWKFSSEQAAKKAEWTRVKYLDTLGLVVRGAGRTHS